jgi:hypothetical protein
VNEVDSGKEMSGLRLLGRIGVGVFAIQLAWMIVWSHTLWSHSNLTFDYTVYVQGWWKISHGHLNPYLSVAHYSLWQDHSVLLMWPIAYVARFSLGGFTPLVVQDLATVAAELIAFTWVMRLLRESTKQLPMQAWKVGAISLVLLTVNPWTYWATSFDIHYDSSLTAPFLVLALRALYYRRHRQLALWAVLTLLCGELAATYLLAVGIAGLLAGVRPDQRRVRASVALVVAGAGSFVLISHLGGNVGSAAGLQSIAHSSSGIGHELSNFTQIVVHPWRLLFAPFHHLRNAWAMLSPAGPFGLLSPWGLPIAAVITTENTAYSNGGFSADAAQYASVWAPLVVASVFAALALAGRRWGRRVGSTVLVLSLLNTAGWAAVWLPQLGSQWLTINSGAGHILAEARSSIPADAEVIASQGAVGGFAARDDVHPVPGPNGSSFYESVERSSVYFVILPYQGLERVPVNQSLALLDELSGPMHAELVLHGYDVWVFKWSPPSALIGRSVNLATGLDPTTVPAWAARSAVGRPILVGPPSSWSMTTVSPKGGYALDGAYFREPIGSYDLRVRLSVTGSASVEAWNTNGQTMLARRILPTIGPETIDVPVVAARKYQVGVYRGRYLFRENPVAPPTLDSIEARVYVPPGSAATVYSVRLIPATTAETNTLGPKHAK